jgi:hypothetical protein
MDLCVVVLCGFCSSLEFHFVLAVCRPEKMKWCGTIRDAKVDASADQRKSPKAVRAWSQPLKFRWTGCAITGLVSKLMQRHVTCVIPQFTYTQLGSQSCSSQAKTTLAVTKNAKRSAPCTPDLSYK